MEIRFVLFEDIDKNKWNGSVHYALNSNVFGYYWYLKSVVKEWDALIEDDYTSVMPIPRNEWSSFQLRLLPGLGPYSVYKLNKERLMTFIEHWQRFSPDFSYTFNHHISDKTILSQIPNVSLKNYYTIDLNNAYETIYSGYSKEFNQIMSGTDLTGYVFGSQEKPEDFLNKTGISDLNKNILYRLFYNALQRGSGWHARIINTKTEKQTSEFFISEAGNINLIFSAQTDLVSTLLLIDSFIQNNAGKPGTLNIGYNGQLADLLGAKSSTLIQSKGSFSGLSGTVKRIFKQYF